MLYMKYNKAKMLGMSKPIWLECKPQYKETLKQKKLSEFGHKIKVGVRMSWVTKAL